MINKLPVSGLYHEEEGHEDKHWELECKWQIFQEGSDKITDPFADVFHRLRDERYNSNRDGLEKKK